MATLDMVRRMHTPCVICGGSPRPYRHDWLFRCPGCGVLSSNLAIDIPDQPTEGALDEAARAVGLDALRRRNNAVILQTLADLPGATAGMRLLDVGCGPGFLLDQAADFGFVAQGIEPDANTLVTGQRRGLSIRGGLFPDVLSPDERFDAIVFNDVLEHIPDLEGVLAAASQHLAPGGRLCLNCPDKRGLFFRVAAALDRLGLSGPYERLWQRGLPSPHVWYFTPALLRRAAERAGLEPSGVLRLATADLKGLWSRIRMVRETSLPMAAAAWAFTWITWPVARLLPRDATACFFRKP